ncbi:RNA pyrophosphohydrolase [Helicobacter sp. MIT 03-1614]|jgi:putative (di)nucleoside polyphosphate hydrolase|nr:MULTISPECIES: RNA pyrophosphohydrolase [Helicobacter]TLD90011.1 RNA pyrophosphohydrolase [Helicobacter sp. MIT 03-1614]
MKSSCTQEKLQQDAPIKKYRPNVAAVILSSVYPKECRFFIAQRLDIKDVWQFPQGGIDEGESPRDALFRELREEIGTDEIEIISECPEWIQYDFPKSMSKKKYKGFAGQIQKYFLVRLKNDAAINIKTKEPEFNKYEFVSRKKLLECVTPFKKGVYKQVLEYFKKEGYL